MVRYSTSVVAAGWLLCVVGCRGVLGVHAAHLRSDDTENGVCPATGCNDAAVDGGRGVGVPAAGHTAGSGGQGTAGASGGHAGSSATPAGTGGSTGAAGISAGTSGNTAVSGTDGASGNTAQSGAGGTTHDGGSGIGGGHAGVSGNTAQSGAGGSSSCDAGYALKDGKCVDIDECTDTSRCGSHGSCENTPGSYRCNCESGYQSGVGGCADIDECDANNGGCEQRCVNLPSTYRCECEPGAYPKPDTKSCWQWHSPIKVETDDKGNADGPRIGAADSGSAVATWRQSDGTHFHVWSNRYRNGSWEAAQKLDNDSNDTGIPFLTTDDTGGATALWLVSFAGYNIHTNRLGSTGWSGDSTLEMLSNSSAFDGPVVAGNRKGDAAVVWGLYAGRGSSFSGRHFDGSSWNSSSTTVPIGAATSMPSLAELEIAMGPGRDAMLAWRQSDMSATNLWVNHFTPGSGWGTATMLSNGGVDATTHARIALGGNSTAIAMWTPGTGGLWANRYSMSGGWSGPSKISEQGDVAGGGFLHVEMDRDGNALALWQQMPSNVAEIWSVRWDAAMASWDTPLRISTAGTGDAAYPALAVGTDGTALAVWTQTDSQHQDVWSNRYTKATGWGTAIKIESDDTGDTANPQVAIDNQGNGFAIWQQSDGMRYNILANHLD